MGGERWRACALAVVLACAPATASAQTFEDEAGALVLSTTSVYVGVAISVVGLTALPFILTTSAAGDAVMDDGTKVERYLRDHEQEVRETLAMGEGALVDDLATGLGLEAGEKARLGQVLRAERAELSALADPSTLTKERALEFMRATFQAIEGDPQLAAALARRAS